MTDLQKLRPRERACSASAVCLALPAYASMGRVGGGLVVTIGTLLGGAVGFYMQKQYTLSEKVRLVVNTARCMLACCACGADKAELFAASRPVLKLALRKKLSGGVGYWRRVVLCLPRYPSTPSGVRRLLERPCEISRALCVSVVGEHASVCWHGAVYQPSAAFRTLAGFPLCL